jgi:hypothetical protein
MYKNGYLAPYVVGVVAVTNVSTLHPVLGAVAVSNVGTLHPVW